MCTCIIVVYTYTCTCIIVVYTCTCTHVDTCTCTIYTCIIVVIHLLYRHCLVGAGTTYNDISVV